jgi:hypothetical protein
MSAISLSLNDPGLEARLRDSAGAIQAAARAMATENDFTVSHIQIKSLSFPKAGSTTPLGCRYMTGRLRDSLRAGKPRVSGAEIISSIGSNMPYAPAMEFGTKPHVIRPKNKKALKFSIGGRMMFRKQVNHPGTAPRGFIQRGITVRLDDYRSSIATAVRGFLGGVA